VRLDKFLQVSRLVRRRSLANDLCHAGRVTVNGRTVVPGAPVRQGDIVTVELGGRRVRARVRAVPDEGTRPDAGAWCEILEDAGA
jgi:ribosomal 50S subunit-recycling heat shock protein